VYEAEHWFPAGVYAPGSNGSTTEGVGSMIPMTPENWSAVAAIASAIVALIALVIAWGQIREARRTRYVDALLTLYDSHQSQDAIAARAIIRDKRTRLKGKLSEPEESMLRAYNQLNFLSSLILGNLVDDKKAKIIFKDAVTTCWRRCETTAIQRIRREGKRDFAKELGKVADAWQRNKKVRKRASFTQVGEQ
jgi:hypothetical protein